LFSEWYAKVGEVVYYFAACYSSLSGLLEVSKSLLCVKGLEDLFLSVRVLYI